MASHNHEHSEMFNSALTEHLQRIIHVMTQVGTSEMYHHIRLSTGVRVGWESSTVKDMISARLADEY